MRWGASAMFPWLGDVFYYAAWALGAAAALAVAWLVWWVVRFWLSGR